MKANPIKLYRVKYYDRRCVLAKMIDFIKSLASSMSSRIHSSRPRHQLG